MNDRIPCEFFLIRYVPDVVKGEFTNIGVLLREVNSEETPHLRFTRDWTRVRCMDANADLALLESLEAEITGRLLTSKTDFKPVMQVLEDTLSNSLQITHAHACLAESLAAELDQLMRLYVEPIKIRLDRSDKVRTGRAAITTAMRSEFERAGVWPMMRKRIAAAMYTAPGDPMKLDCGYRAEADGGIIRVFHAVSLESDVEAAKVLAFTAPQLYQGIARVEKARLELTAIVEPFKSIDAEAADTYRFGIDTMERQLIRVMTIADLGRIAETARVELQL